MFSKIDLEAITPTAASCTAETEREIDVVTDVALLEVPPPRHAASPARQHLPAACDV
jgi:hypothetical protein